MKEKGKEEKLVVNGFEFTNREEYDKAVEEKKSIDKLMKKLDLNNKPMVLAVYGGIIKDSKLSTVVGLEYLRNLRTLIIQNRYATEEELPPVQVNAFKSNQADTVKLMKANKVIAGYKNSGSKDKEKVKLLMIVNFILVAVIAAMMYISSTSSNVNILNYEKEIRDKYSAWEINLTERENKIKAKERELGIQAGN